MHGFVSQEKEKFERLARQMKHQRKDLEAKSAAIQQVKELIRNSPHITRTPLREAQVRTLFLSFSLPPCLACPLLAHLCSSPSHNPLSSGYRDSCYSWCKEKYPSCKGQRSQEVCIRELAGACAPNNSREWSVPRTSGGMSWLY